MSEIQKKIQKLLDDPFLKDFASEDFSATAYISTQSSKGEVKNLVDSFFTLTEKEKSLDECLNLLALNDKEFFQKQFSIPKKYGVR